MSKIILTFNAGSSSLKFAAFGADNGVLNHLAAGQVEGIGATPKGSVKLATGEKSDFVFDAAAGKFDHQAATNVILAWLRDVGYADGIVAVGHRVVHGGPDMAAPMLIDEATLQRLRKLIPLAPLHQPHNIAGIEAAIKAFPGTPQVACFDTAFHRSHPFVSDTFALPRSYYDEGVRRYGFHGLSYEYITRALTKIAPADRARGRHRRPSRQRRLDVRDQERPLDGLDHGLHRARRPADGHALRPARPGRAALSDGREEDERRADLGPPLQGVRPQGHVGNLPGHARARGLRQPRGARGDRLFRAPDTSRARGPRRHRRRRRGRRLHRRHRRAFLARAQGRAHRHGMDGHPARRGSQPRQRADHQREDLAGHRSSSSRPTKSA